MDTNIKTALLVLLVGMITVFVVLCLVVLTGKLLIYLVNRYGPVSSKTKISSNDFKPLLSENLNLGSTLSQKKIAAIISTVDVVTHGKGKVIQIEKIPST